MTFTKNGHGVGIGPRTVKPKRNTHAIGFNDEEYAIIADKAKKAGLYPRQYIVMKAKADK